MSGWEDVDPEDFPDPSDSRDDSARAGSQRGLFADRAASIDPLVFGRRDSSPELRWTLEAAPEVDLDLPPLRDPQPLSSGRALPQWSPGPAPQVAPQVPSKAPRIVRAVLFAALPFVAVAVVTVVTLRVYGVL